MSSSSLDSAEEQWKAQLAAMRAAIADMKLPSKSTNDEHSFDYNIPYIEDIDSTSASSADDIWDLSSDAENQDSSDANDDATPESPMTGYGLQWLKSRCLGFASRKQGLSAEDLEEQIMALLASDSVTEELQSTLTDIVGFDDLDFVIELISNRTTLIASPPFATKKNESIFGKIQTKREREEALRQRDYEHKHSTLGPSLDRDGPQYPHVYKTHAAGNTLDHRGKKYGLPVGHERTEHHVSSYYVNVNFSPLLSSLIYGMILLLTLKSYMKSTPFLLLRWALSAEGANSLKFPRWMASVSELSKATNL